MRFSSRNYSVLAIILILLLMSCDEEATQITANQDCKLTEQLITYPSNLIYKTTLKHSDDGKEIEGTSFNNASGVWDTINYIMSLDDIGRIIKNCAQPCLGYYSEFIYNTEQLIQVNQYNNNILWERWDLEYNLNKQVVKTKKYYTNEGALFLASYLDLQYSNVDSKNPISITSYDVNGKMVLKREFKYDNKKISFYGSYILSDNYGVNNPIQIIYSNTNGITQTINNTYEYNDKDYPVSYSSIVTYSNGTSYGPIVAKYSYDCK